MSVANRGVEIFHLGWRQNGDGLDVALAVNRLLSAGARVWRMAAPQSPAGAGDYLLELMPLAPLKGIIVFGCPVNVKVPP